MGKGEKTRINLIKSSIGLFADKGFEETTFKDIAQAAGVTQPLLYSYFKNKMNLMLSCCLYSADLGRASIASHIKPTASASDNLKQYIYGNLDWFYRDPINAHVILSMYYFAGSDPQIHKVFFAAQEKAQLRIAEIIKKGAAQREWKVQNIEEVAQSIHSLLVGEIYKQYYPTEQKSPKSRSEQLHKTCLKLLK